MSEYSARITAVVKALDILLREVAPSAIDRTALWDEVIMQAELYRLGAELTAGVEAGKIDPTEDGT